MVLRKTKSNTIKANNTRTR